MIPSPIPNLLILCNLFYPNEMYSEVIQRIYSDKSIDEQYYILKNLQLYIKEESDIVFNNIEMFKLLERIK